MKPFSNWSASDYAAWWGAIVASIVFVWEIVKYARQGPRLRITARPNMIQIPPDAIAGDVNWICVEVVNVGDQGTTLTTLGGYHFDSALKLHFRRWKVAKHAFVFPNPQGPALPFFIEPGKRWSALIAQERIFETTGREGVLRIVIHDAVSGKETASILRMSSLEKRGERKALAGLSPG